MYREFPGPEKYYPYKKDNGNKYSFSLNDNEMRDLIKKPTSPSLYKYNPKKYKFPNNHGYEFFHPSPRFKRVSINDPETIRGPGSYIKVKMEKDIDYHIPMTVTPRECCKPSFYTTMNTFEYNNNVNFIEKNIENNSNLTKENIIKQNEIKKINNEIKQKEAEKRAIIVYSLI